MTRRKTITYKEAGVDITANDRMIDLIKPIVRATYGPRVLGGELPLRVVGRFLESVKRTNFHSWLN